MFLQNPQHPRLRETDPKLVFNSARVNAQCADDCANSVHDIRDRWDGVGAAASECLNA